MVMLLLLACTDMHAMEKGEKSYLYDQKISLLDAYMGCGFDATHNGISVLDYADPEVVYKFDIAQVNNEIFDITAELADAKQREIFVRKAHEAIKLSEASVHLLTKERQYTLQKALMLEFSHNTDLEMLGLRLFKIADESSTSPREQLMMQIAWNRELYKKAWATADLKKINTVKNLQIHLEPYVPLMQKIKKDVEK